MKKIPYNLIAIATYGIVCQVESSSGQQIHVEATQKYLCNNLSRAYKGNDFQ